MARQQVYAIGGRRPAQRHKLPIGADPDGRVRSLHHWTRQRSSTVSGYTEYGSRMTKTMCDTGELGYLNELAHLNLPAPSVMRGPGFMTGGWALETALDALAAELDIDPIALRLEHHTDVDPDSGAPDVCNLANYHVAGCADTPHITVDVMGIPDRNVGPLGARGVGELGTNGVPPASGDVIFNATRLRRPALPYSPDKLLDAVR